jgi:hypothetical protein
LHLLRGGLAREVRLDTSERQRSCDQHQRESKTLHGAHHFRAYLVDA